MFPGAGVIPLRHTARGERQIQTPGLTGDDFKRGRAREPCGGSRGKSVGTGGKIERDTTARSSPSLRTAAVPGDKSRARE